MRRTAYNLRGQQPESLARPTGSLIGPTILHHPLKKKKKINLKNKKLNIN